MIHLIRSWILVERADASGGDDDRSVPVVSSSWSKILRKSGFESTTILGMTLGALDGVILGASDGASESIEDGKSDGRTIGASLGVRLG